MPPSRAAINSPWLDDGGRSICSIRVRYDPPFIGVTAAPTVQHESPRTQATEPSRLAAVTFGLGWILQVTPSHASMKASNWGPPPPPVLVLDAPTAQQVS